VQPTVAVAWDTFQKAKTWDGVRIRVVGMRSYAYVPEKELRGLCLQFLRSMITTDDKIRTQRFTLGGCSKVGIPASTARKDNFLASEVKEGVNILRVEDSGQDED